jgi:competence protein ComEC
LAPDTMPGHLLVHWSCDQPLQQVHRGDRVCVTGSSRLPEAFDGFDYPSYLARRNIFASLFADDVVRLERPSAFSLWAWGDRLRQRLLLRLRQALPADLAAMAQSLMFGDRSALPLDIENAFARTGLMHLLAVSGLHLGIFLAAAWWVLRRMGFRPRVAYPVVGCLVLLALTIVGPRVSLVRAGLLFAFLALGSVLADCGVILKRWVHPLNGLAAAAIAILLIRPGALYDAGFQLTMAATGSILIAFSPSGWGTRLSRPSRKGILGTCGCWLRRMIVVSAAAQAGAAPVIAWHFGAFHPLSILINLVAVPLAGISLWAGLLSLLVSATAAFDLAVIPLAFLLRALEIVVKWLAQIPIAELLATPPMGLWMGGCVVFAYLMAYCESLSSRISKSMSMEFESDEG